MLRFQSPRSILSLAACLALIGIGGALPVRDVDGKSASQFAAEQSLAAVSEMSPVGVEPTGIANSRDESEALGAGQHEAPQDVFVASHSAAHSFDTSSGHPASTGEVQLSQPTVLYSAEGGVRASRLQDSFRHVETRSYVPADAAQPSQVYLQQSQRGRPLSRAGVARVNDDDDGHVLAKQQAASYLLPTPVVVKHTAMPFPGREISEVRTHHPVLEPRASVVSPAIARTKPRTENLELVFPQLPLVRPNEYNASHNDSGVELNLVSRVAEQIEVGEAQESVSPVVLSTKRVLASDETALGIPDESGGPVEEFDLDAWEPETVQIAAATLDGLQLTLPIRRPEPAVRRSSILGKLVVPVARPQQLSTGSQIAVGRGEKSSRDVLQSDKPGKAFNSAEEVILSSHGNGLNLNKLLLIGTFGTESNRKALVRFPDGEVYQIRVGSKLNGGQVVAIKTDSVILVANNQSFVLR